LELPRRIGKLAACAGLRRIEALVSRNSAYCESEVLTATDYDWLFETAYEAKAAGRNCVVGERPAAPNVPGRLAHAH
jgi:hypothetical protein